MANETNYNRLLAMVLGWVLLLVGILGFVPGITSHAPGPVTGHAVPAAKILGIFEVNIIHNIVHVGSGLFLLAGAYMAGGVNARMYNLILGVVYAIVALGGLAVKAISDLVAIDGADHGLHAILAIVLLAVPFLVKEAPAGRTTSMR